MSRPVTFKTMRAAAALVAVVTVCLGLPDSTFAATRHARRHHAAATRFVPRHRAAVATASQGAYGSAVYGASAPYYLQGPGGGDAYGDDPIGGPDHVGNGGPGAVLGGTFRGLTDAEARRAAGWR